MKIRGKKLVAQIFMALIIMSGLFRGTATKTMAVSQNQDIKLFTEVTIIADVPEGYDKDVVVRFQSEEETIIILLQAAHNYTDVQWIIEGTYATSAWRKNSTDFCCEIPESCEVQGQKMEFRFTVLPVLEEVTESEAQAILDQAADQTVGSDVNGLESGKEIIQEFLDKTAYIVDTDYYKRMDSRSNENENYKKIFLEFEGDNITEEKWNSMSGYDVFIYLHTYLMPYERLMNNNYSNEDQFVKAAGIIESYRNQNEDVFADALEKVIRWQWKYFEHTGTIYNFFAEEGEENVHFNQPSSTNTGLSEEEKREIEAARAELFEGEDLQEIKEAMAEQEKESGSEKSTEVHWTIIIVFILLGVGIIVAFLYIKYRGGMPKDHHS